jgi:hypothetical protein
MAIRTVISTLFGSDDGAGAKAETTAISRDDGRSCLVESFSFGAEDKGESIGVEISRRYVTATG